MFGKSNSNRPDDNPDDTQEAKAGITITRREALITAISAGVAQSFASAPAAAQTGDAELEFTLNYEDEEHRYEQYHNGTLESFGAMPGTTVTVDVEGTTDSQLQLRGYLTVNGGSEAQLINDIAEIPQPLPTGGESIEFNAPSIWDDEVAEGTLDSTTPFDFAWLNTISDDYSELSPPETVDSDADLTQETRCDIRFEVISNGAEIQREKAVTFTLHIGHKMGFGAKFGSSFGRDHVQAWDGNDGWG